MLCRKDWASPTENPRVGTLAGRQRGCRARRRDAELPRSILPLGTFGIFIFSSIRLFVFCAKLRAWNLHELAGAKSLEYDDFWLLASIFIFA